MATRFTVQDYLPMFLLGANDDYAFGLASAGSGWQLYRVATDLTDAAVFDARTLADQDSTSEFSYILPGWGSTIFAVVKCATDRKFYLFKSVDNGAHWGANSPTYDDLQWVKQIGERGGTHTGDVYILGTRGFCVAEIGGSRVLLFGEYNVNGSRVSGGTNDWVRLWKSVDDGDTWIAAVTWNTSGHQTRHIHAVLQDPYTGDIYVGTGDTNSDSGIIRWNGQTPWPDNTSLAALATTDGFNSFSGSQRYRCVDLIFMENFIINPADNSGGGDAERGIWKFDRAFSSYERVDSQSTENAGHSMYWSLKTANGSLIATELLESVAATDQSIFVYTSNDGITWKKSGVLLGSTAIGTTVTRSPKGLFEWNGYVCIGLSNGAGKDRFGTTFLTITYDFDEQTPDVLYPAYWIATTGTDSSGTGYRPSDPMKTLDYALTGDRVTDGARIFVAAGTYYESKATAAWSGNARPSESSNQMVISGAGESTVIRVKDGQPKLLNQNANGGPVKFTDMWINDHQPADTVSDVIEFSDDTEGTVEMNARIGWAGSALRGPVVI